MPEANEPAPEQPSPLSETPILHLYGQEDWHDRVRIVGNRQALNLLMLTLIDALSSRGKGEATLFPADGEGYALTIECLDQPFGHPDWEKRDLPYWSDIAGGPAHRGPDGCRAYADLQPPAGT